MSGTADATKSGHVIGHVIGHLIEYLILSLIERHRGSAQRAHDKRKHSFSHEHILVCICGTSASRRFAS
ncbi:hypothetical protein GCM10027343_40820 [Noviherbaspirillum agri]